MKNKALKSRILIPAISLFAAVSLLFYGCSGVVTVTVTVTAPPTTSAAPPTTTGNLNTSTPASTTTTTTVPAGTTSPPATSTVAPPITTPFTAPVTPSLTFGTPLIKNRSLLNSTQYVVFAWNDLGMHCSNPSYDKAVLLPPYNTIWAQVVQRGNPPRIVTAGLTVEYKILDNTSSYNKGLYGQFWDNAKTLFGVELAKDTGLNLVDPAIHNGLSGTMLAKADHFQADGIPVTPLNDDGTWNPYQVAQIIVKNSAGTVIAGTDATVPISSEINCAKCHGADAFEDILAKHDRNVGTSLARPVLCAACHGDPALGTPKNGAKYLSDAIHGFHSTVSPQPSCYDCHPGGVTKCSRSIAHSTADGNCQTCHGSLATVSSSIQQGRVPWGNEPQCVTCHTGVAEVNTPNVLYRNATGHNGIYCASCHSSPHAMVPSTTTIDNYQALQYQGAAKAIGSCGVCHANSRGQTSIREFSQEHGGSNPRVPNACTVCHTVVPTDTTRWPHAFQWQGTQGTSTAEDD